MSRWAVLLVGSLFAVLVAVAADASFQTRERNSLHSPQQPRILNVYSEAGRLYISGQNLPAGEGVKVRLGKQSLEVMLTSRSIIIASLPSAAVVGGDYLEVRRGVRRARIDGSRLRWGLLLPRHQ